MDTLTHALSGAVLARASAPGEGQGLTLRRRLAVGFLAGAFPDSDFVLRFFTDPLTYLNLHRGVTHSLLMLPLWALVLAGCFALLWREPARWRLYFGVSALALGIHIAGDVITSFGTQILAPFSSFKAAFPTTFIIDLWFSAILVLGLLASWFWRRSRLPARIALAVLVAYVTGQAVLQQRALGLGEAYARQQGLEGAQVHALPQPLSPLNWKLIVVDGEHYHVAYVHLFAGEAHTDNAAGGGFFRRLAAAYRPPADLRWRRLGRYGENPQQVPHIRALWQQPLLAGYRRFARYPVLHALESRAEGECAWFQDLRFSLDGVAPPFRYGLCRNGEGEALYRMDRAGEVLPVSL